MKDFLCVEKALHGLLPCAMVGICEKLRQKCAEFSINDGFFAFFIRDLPVFSCVDKAAAAS